MYLSRFISDKTMAAGLMLLASLSLGSCADSFIYDDLPECRPEYKVRLSFDKNLESVERVSDVKAAEIYAFDMEGKLVATSFADGEMLQANDWTMPIDLKRHQTYDLVIWGGLTEDSPFRLDGTRAVTSKDDLVCRLTTVTDEEGNEVSDSKFPALFHHAGTYTFTTEDGEEMQTAKLTKNTNTFKVVLHKDNRATVRPDEYATRITDRNSAMSHDNSLADDKTVTYKAAEIEYGTYEVTDPATSQKIEVPCSRSEFHVARLTPESKPALSVFATDGSRIASIDMMDLITQVKKKERPDMDMQEYLDRQDEFDVELQVEVDDMLIHFEVIVNGWVAVIQNIEWK